MNNGYRQLACAITYQAVRDYFVKSEYGRMAILNELRSDWMDFITDGMSLTVADKLENSPDEIKARIRKHEMEEQQ